MRDEREWPKDTDPQDHSDPNYPDHDDNDYHDDDDDDDVPFRLPRAKADTGVQAAQQAEQGTSTSANTEQAEQPDTYDPNNPHVARTMPAFREPGADDPKLTLPGTGGLDPNPDMPAAADALPSLDDTDELDQATIKSHADQIAQTSQATLMNQRAYRRPTPPPQQQAKVPAPTPRPQPYAMPSNNPNHQRYQRPAYPQQQQQPPHQQPMQGGYMPPAPQHNAAHLPKRRRRRILGVRAGCLYVVLGLMLTFCGGLTLISTAAAAIFVPQIEAEWDAQISQVDDYRAFESTLIYDRYGDLLFEAFDEGRRITVPYERFPQHLIQATIAIEDDSFFSNIGIDIAATTVATLQFLGAEADEQTPGGSTITQQLVRNVLFDFEKRAERSVERKVEEIILAMLLTQRRSKEDILTMYLNEIYYGNLAYGAQTASQTFFGKNVEDLTLGEAALLAGLPQAPASLDPLDPSPDVQQRVDTRWRRVLNEMLEEAFITQAEHDAALRAGLSFVQPAASLKAPHFTVYAQAEYKRLMGELGYSPSDVIRGGYRVYTTVDQAVNDVALNAARSQVAQLRATNNVTNAAVLVLKPLTGEIISMIGSIDYNSTTIDGRVNVTTSLRQPGSTVKPFTYAAAMELGMTAGDVLWDTPTEIGIPGQPAYVPANYDRDFHGPMTLRRALANSYNIPAVQTLRLVGVDYLLQLMQRFGVETLGTDAARYGLSLTLGGGEISLVELANAYAVLANQGSYINPTSILCIIDTDDDIIYEYESGCPEGRRTQETVERMGFGQQVLDPRIAFTMTDILSDNNARSVEMGANSDLRTPGIETAVKTGTTDNIKDNWTVGYTRNVVVGVWVGNNDGQPMVRSSGLTGAAPIWNEVMTRIYNDGRLLDAMRVGGQLLPDKPAAPSGMSLRQICDVRRIQDPASSCSQISEWLLDGPAGIPDENGRMQYPQPVLNTSQRNPNLQEISPDVYRARVMPLPPNIANGIQFTVNFDAGEKQPPAPKYCRVPAETNPAPVNAQDLIFIAGPATSQADLVEAQRYARSNNLAFLPTIDCWQDVLSGPSYGPTMVTAIITSPQNGQVVSAMMPIMGTAQFDSSQADYYRVEVIGGQFSEWTPLGQPGYGAVINGQLETLHVPALQNGTTYRLRLGIVRGMDYIQQPYEVAFSVSR